MTCVTTRLFIGPNNLIPSTPVNDAILASEMIEQGIRVNVPTPTMAVDVLVLLGVDVKVAQRRVSQSFGSTPAQASDGLPPA